MHKSTYDQYHEHLLYGQIDGSDYCNLSHIYCTGLVFWLHILRCFVNLSDDAKDLCLQRPHLKGFTPVCEARCTVNSPRCQNDLLQKSHRYLLPPASWNR